MKNGVHRIKERRENYFRTVIATKLGTQDLNIHVEVYQFNGVYPVGYELPNRRDMIVSIGSDSRDGSKIAIKTYNKSIQNTIKPGLRVLNKNIVFRDVSLYRVDGMVNGVLPIRDGDKVVDIHLKARIELLNGMIKGIKISI